VEDKLTLEVVTPYGQVMSEEVDEVVAAGTEGEFGVLPGHVSFVTTLKVGMLTYKSEGKSRYVFINSGYSEVTSDSVMVLADSAERSEDIDVERAKEAMRRAEERLKKEEERDFIRSEAALERAVMRVQVAEKEHSK
jgi:F-type H+-transporting ATPase subunit epsilon